MEDQPSRLILLPFNHCNADRWQGLELFNAFCFTDIKPVILTTAAGEIPLGSPGTVGLNPFGQLDFLGF